MSLFAINQAFDRRFTSSGGDPAGSGLTSSLSRQRWKAVPYGVMDNREQEPGEALQPLAYFRQHWFVTSYPEPFSLDNEARIEWTLFRTLGLDDIDDPLLNEQDALIPLVAMLPDGYIEPRRRVAPFLCVQSADLLPIVGMSKLHRWLCLSQRHEKQFLLRPRPWFHPD